MADRTEPGERLLPFFTFAHLPEPLKAASEPFAELALQVTNEIPAGPERTVCLRKLLEAKDCAVRAVLEAKKEQPLGQSYGDAVKTMIRNAGS